MFTEVKHVDLGWNGISPYHNYRLMLSLPVSA